MLVMVMVIAMTVVMHDHAPRRRAHGSADACA